MKFAYTAKETWRVRKSIGKFKRFLKVYIMKSRVS